MSQVFTPSTVFKCNTFLYKKNATFNYDSVDRYFDLNIRYFQVSISTLYSSSGQPFGGCHCIPLFLFLTYFPLYVARLSLLRCSLQFSSATKRKKEIHSKLLPVLYVESYLWPLGPFLSASWTHKLLISVDSLVVHSAIYLLILHISGEASDERVRKGWPIEKATETWQKTASWNPKVRGSFSLTFK